MMLIIHFIIRQEVSPVCFLLFVSRLSLALLPLIARWRVYQKNTAYAFVHTGVWHNPRIKKQKQYIPKYALTHCQSNS